MSKPSRPSIPRALNAELVEGTKVRFTCAAGHSFTEDMACPHGKRHPARLSSSAVAQLVHYWQPAPGAKFGALKGTCKRCDKAAALLRK